MNATSVVRRLVSVIVTVMVSALAAGALGACSSDDGSDGTANGDSGSSSTVTTGSGDWDVAAVAELDTVAAQVAKAFPGQCEELAPLPYGQYHETARVLKFDPPLAASDCEAGGENLEFSAFADVSTRDAFVRDRTDLICERAKQSNVDVDGLHWIVGGDWSIQSDTQGMGRQVARALDVSYQAEACPGVEQINWEETAVEHVEALAEKLAAEPRIGCEQFMLLDRSEYLRDPNYRDRLPAAFGQCNGPSNSVIWITAFSPTSVARDAFLADEVELLCTGSRSGIEAVRGDDFGIIATQTQVAGQAAAATGGTALPPGC
jgi:hypothetical protein